MAEKTIRFVDGHIEIDDVPKRPKKMTGTRFASVLGLNAWSTPFEMWCAMTRVYEKPFEESIYTHAGKVIEPKVVEYLRDVYFMELETPEDVYGQDFFKKTWGDFYPTEKIFGGMWDVLGDSVVVEIKTTQRVEDWQHDIPIYYKLQPALYAYLLGLDDVTVTASFLKPSDYDHPENFEPSIENTKVFEYKISEAFPDFEEQYLKPAIEFWNEHVLTGISPKYDEKKDAEILKELRTNYITATDDEIGDLMKEADDLLGELSEFDSILKEKRDRLKFLEGKIKDYMVDQFDEADTRVELTSNNFIWTTSKSSRNTFDSKALQKDHPSIYDSYMKQTETMTLRKTAVNK